jgi:hypothetical protein
LNDCHVFDFEERSWAALATEGTAPIPRDSHVAVAHGGSMFIFGGSTGRWEGVLSSGSCCVGTFIKLFGVAVSASASAVLFVFVDALFYLSTLYKFSFYASAMNDFHELRLDAKKWQPVQALGPSPGPRFCHVASVYGDSMLVFGGYDGSNRLNDFVEFHLGLDLTSSLAIPPSTLVRAMI